MFIIEDERHAESGPGKYSTREDAIKELERLAQIPWNEHPNRAPCSSSHNCGRSYEIVEYDDSETPWKELSRVLMLEISAAGIEWSDAKEQAGSF